MYFFKVTNLDDDNKEANDDNESAKADCQDYWDGTLCSVAGGIKHLFRLRFSAGNLVIFWFACASLFQNPKSTAAFSALWF